MFGLDDYILGKFLDTVSKFVWNKWFRRDSFEGYITPEKIVLDTKIKLKVGDILSGEFDLANPFCIDTRKNFPWMDEFKTRYRNNGTKINEIHYFDVSGIKEFDESGKYIPEKQPGLDTWAAIYLEVGDKKYRLDLLSRRKSIIHKSGMDPEPDYDQNPIVINSSGKLLIKINDFPYREGTEGKIKIKIRKHISG